MRLPALREELERALSTEATRKLFDEAKQHHPDLARSRPPRLCHLGLHPGGGLQEPTGGRPGVCRSARRERAARSRRAERRGD